MNILEAVATLREISPNALPVRSGEDGLDAAGWAQRISLAWRQSLEAIFETGRALIDAKAALPHGAFVAMIESDLPFTRQTAHKLMTIVQDDRLLNVAHVRHLPASWGTLYELTKLPPERFDAALAAGTIRPDMERAEAARLITAGRRETRERDLAASTAAAAARLGRAQYGVIYADPPWRFDVRSRETGLERSADNHYPTMKLSDVCRMPVVEIAARDCALFLWATAPMLPYAFTVMDNWGFAYKSHFVWVKPALGTGYWNRNRHELLLVGTHGDPPCPAPGDQWPSVIESGPEDSRRHSAKPAAARAMIEAYFPSASKIELFARAQAPGWDVWGNEAPNTTGGLA